MATRASLERIVDGRIWAEFCDQLKETGAAVLREGTPADPLTRAEGWRYLTRLLRAGLDSALEFGDPRLPGFYQLSNEVIKIGNDNPDNIYHNTTISGRYEYRITGNRGTVPFLSFGTKAGSYASTGEMIPTGQVEAEQLEIAPGGDFELHVSCREHPGNWLPMKPESSMLLVRQTFLDRPSEEPAQYRIECLDPPEDTRLDLDSFEERLFSSLEFVKGTANLFVDWMEGYEKHLNQLPSDDQARCQAAGGDRTIHYFQSYWRLEEDQALIVEARKIPDCTTWNLQLSDYWMQSLDYRHHRIHVNKHSAHYEDDGGVRIVIAHRDPGPSWPNWLTTQGHREGGMLFRWVQADEHPPLETRVVHFAEL